MLQKKISFVNKFACIDSFQLKCFGIFFMTIDHVAAYIFAPYLGDHVFRILGRIAAPLFLFVLVNSVHYTRSKVKLAFRLYVAHVLICLTTLLLNSYESDWFGVFDNFSILAMFAYTVWYIYIIECIIYFVRKAKKEKVLMYIVLGIGSTILPIFFLFATSEIYTIVIPNILLVEYSPFFILMGICWYFAKSKKKMATMLAFFSLFSLVGSFILPYLNMWMFADFFAPSQFWMILFIPFLFLYNQKKGRSIKYFFYLYYPIHIYVLLFIGKMLN